MIIANNKFATIFSRFGSFKLCLIFFVNDISCYCHCVKSVQIRSFFWSVFSRIWTIISPYSVRMRENTDQKNSVFGHFSGSVCTSKYLFRGYKSRSKNSKFSYPQAAMVSARKNDYFIKRCPQKISGNDPVCSPRKEKFLF